MRRPSWKTLLAAAILSACGDSITDPPPSLASITVTLSATTLNVGQTAQASATLKDASGNGFVVQGDTVKWGSSNLAVATVSSRGLVTATGPGTAAITASVAGKSGSTTLTVSAAPPPPPAPVASVTVSLGQAAIVPGQTALATATVKDAASNTLSGRAVTWTASPASIATISATGVITGQTPGSATVTATSEGISGTATITVSPPPPPPVTSVTITIADSVLATNAQTSVTVVLRDGNGTLVTDRTAALTSSNTGVATVFAGGAVTGTGPGTAAITAAIDGKSASVGVRVFTVAVGIPAQLTITTPPSASAQSGATFAQQPVIQVRDGGGNIVNQAGIVVTVSIGSGAGTLGGTTTATSNASGVATFSNLSITGTVGARTLFFSAPGLTPANSSIVTITPSAPTQLAILTQPSTSAQSGVAFAQQPAIQLRDAANNAVSQAGVVVTAAIASGTGGTLGGTTTATTNSAGVATFTNLNITSSGGPYTLSFSATGVTPASSSSVTVGAVSANQLSIATQPSATAQSGSVFAQQPAIQLRDAANNAVSQAGVVVTAAVVGGGTLGGTPTATTNASGVATFSGLSITGTIGNRTLSFAATSFTSVTSSAIAITAGAGTKLAMSTQPSAAATSGSAFAQQPAVQIQDASGNAVSQAGVVVTVARNTGTGTLSGTTTATTNASGIASFTGLTITGSGSHTLSFIAPGLTQVVSSAVSVTGASGNKLGFVFAPPTDVLTGTVFSPQPKIQVQDAAGTSVSGAGVVITAAITAGNATLNGTKTATTFSNGFTYFTDLGLSGSGSSTVTFSAPGIASVSITINVTTTPTKLDGCTNEPAGYTRIQEQTWDVTPVRNVRTSMGWTDEGGNGASAFSVVNDPTTPFPGNNNVVAGKFPQGSPGGSGPFSTMYTFASNEKFPKLYLCIYIKHSANFDNTGNGGNAGTKFMWPAADIVDGTETYLSHDGPEMDFGLFQQGRSSRQLVQNVGAPVQTFVANRRGQWMRYEMLFVTNAANGTANGQFHLWIDGIKTHQYTDIDYTTSSARSWQSLKWNPTYGGGLSPVPADQFQYIDHIRMSGSP